MLSRELTICNIACVDFFKDVSSLPPLRRQKLLSGDYFNVDGGVLNKELYSGVMPQLFYGFSLPSYEKYEPDKVN
jgi:hypothetical protein